MLKKDLINLFKIRCQYKCQYNFKIRGLTVDILIPARKTIIQFLSPSSYCNNKENVRIKMIKKLRNYNVITVPYYIPLTNIILKTLFNRMLRYYRATRYCFIDFNNIYPAKYCDSGLSDFKNDLDRFWYYRKYIIECLQDAVISNKHDTPILPSCMFPLLFTI